MSPSSEKPKAADNQQERPTEGLSAQELDRLEDERARARLRIKQGLDVEGYKAKLKRMRKPENENPGLSRRQIQARGSIRASKKPLNEADNDFSKSN